MENELRGDRKWIPSPVPSKSNPREIGVPSLYPSHVTSLAIFCRNPLTMQPTNSIPCKQMGPTCLDVTMYVWRAIGTHSKNKPCCIGLWWHQERFEEGWGFLSLVAAEGLQPSHTMPQSCLVPAPLRKAMNSLQVTSHWLGWIFFASRHMWRAPTYSQSQGCRAHFPDWANARFPLLISAPLLWPYIDHRPSLPLPTAINICIVAT